MSAAPEVLGSGTLVLAPTAHAMVGSSPSVFSRATSRSTLREMLALKGFELDEDAQAQIRDEHDPERIKSWVLRVLTAETLADVFAVE